MTPPLTFPSPKFTFYVVFPSILTFVLFLVYIPFLCSQSTLIILATTYILILSLLSHIFVYVTLSPFSRFICLTRLLHFSVPQVPQIQYTDNSSFTPKFAFLILFSTWLRHHNQLSFPIWKQKAPLIFLFFFWFLYLPSHQVLSVSLSCRLLGWIQPCLSISVALVQCFITSSMDFFYNSLKSFQWLSITVGWNSSLT